MGGSVFVVQQLSGGRFGGREEIVVLWTYMQDTLQNTIKNLSGSTSQINESVASSVLIYFHKNWVNFVLFCPLRKVPGSKQCWKKKV